jgi:outer membrane protein TolC
VAEVSVPLPIFDRNQGARAAARSDLRRAEHEKRALQARLAAALEAAYQELAARFDEVTRLREEILPGAADAFEQVRQGYAQGSSVVPSPRWSSLGDMDVSTAHGCRATPVSSSATRSASDA